MNRIVFPAVFLVALSAATQARADLLPPIPTINWRFWKKKPPPPPPPVKIDSLPSFDFVLDLDESCNGARLQIPRSLVSRRGLTALPNGASGPPEVTTGCSTRTCIAGLALASAFACGGLCLMRRQTTSLRRRFLFGSMVLLAGAALWAWMAQASSAHAQIPPWPWHVEFEVVEEGKGIRLIMNRKTLAGLTGRYGVKVDVDEGPNLPASVSAAGTVPELLPEVSTGVEGCCLVQACPGPAGAVPLAPEPRAGEVVRILPLKGEETVAAGKTSSTGRFRIPVPPGNYRMDSGEPIEVREGKLTSVQITHSQVLP